MASSTGIGCQKARPVTSAARSITGSASVNSLPIVVIPDLRSPPRPPARLLTGLCRFDKTAAAAAGAAAVGRGRHPVSVSERTGPAARPRQAAWTEPTESFPVSR
ncbi:MAG: hypothetical protein Kow0045_15110 [Albidovulum sp.]